MSFIMCTSFITLSGCASKISTFSQDDGNSISVINSSVTTDLFDSKEATNAYEKWISRINTGLANCIKDFPNKKMCQDEYGKALKEKQSEQDAIKDMPEISIVRFKVQQSNDNVETRSSQFQYVACLPSDSKLELTQMKNIITSVNELTNKPPHDLKYGLVDNENTLTDKLCSRYVISS